MTHAHPSSRPRLAAILALLALLGAAVPAGAQSTLVFQTDFESGLPAEFSAPGTALDPVQGWAGLGPPGHQFGGVFLRYSLQGIVDTKLTLRNLPPHDRVEIGFLLAIIDSWDGTELLKLAIDGNEVFSHWFQLATGDTSSYPAPAGGLLSRGVNLGYSNGTYYFRDRAYDMAVEPGFRAIPHTADTLEVKWFLGAVSGGAASQWQGGGDESWALDHVTVTTHRDLTDADPGEAPALQLALEAPAPNPARTEGLTVRFTLPRGVPARLDLFDARGRRLAARDLSGLAPGSHAVTLAPDGPRTAGVAFLRLAQGTQSRTRRVVILD